MIIIIPRRLGDLALRIIKEELKLAIVDFCFLLGFGRALKLTRSVGFVI